MKVISPIKYFFLAAYDKFVSIADAWQAGGGFSGYFYKILVWSCIKLGVEIEGVQLYMSTHCKCEYMIAGIIKCLVVVVVVIVLRRKVGKSIYVRFVTCVVI